MTEYRESPNAIGEINPGDHTFELRVVSYGVADSYGSVWEPGVFDDSLRARLPSAAWAHNHERIIGSLKEFDLRSDGVHGLVQLANIDDVPDARMAWSLLKDGHVKDTSFGFVRQEWTDKRSDRNYKPTLQGESERLKRARLDEVSPVLVGAVPGAGVTSTRSDGRIDYREATRLMASVATGKLELRDALNLLAARADVDPADALDLDLGDGLVKGKLVSPIVFVDQEARAWELQPEVAETAIELMDFDGLPVNRSLPAADAFRSYWTSGPGRLSVRWNEAGWEERAKAVLTPYLGTEAPAAATEMRSGATKDGETIEVRRYDQKSVEEITADLLDLTDTDDPFGD